MKDDLTRRLRAVVDMAAGVEVVADIGCDHGLTAKALLTEKNVKKVIACDISADSLQKTVDLARKEGLQTCLETRCGDGLAPLGEKEAQVIIIAGMGGMLIRDILSRALRTAHDARWLVLAPQGNEDVLRRFLYENNFVIADEDMVCENDHYYQIIQVKNGIQPLPEEIELLFGPKLLAKKEPVFRKYLAERLKEYRVIMESARRGKNTGDYIEKLSLLCSRISEVLA